MVGRWSQRLATTALPIAVRLVGCRTGLMDGCRLLVGEADEREPRPPQHRAEHVQPVQDAAVDEQRLSEGPHPRPTAPVLTATPLPMSRRDQPPELAADPAYPAARACAQPLRRAPADAAATQIRSAPTSGTSSKLRPPRRSSRPPRAGQTAPARSRAPSHTSCRTSRPRPGTCPRARGRRDVYPFPRGLQWSPPAR